MEVMEAIRGRRSVRRFADLPLEEEKLGQILEAARLAPSARNMQDWRFIVVRDREMRLRLARAARDQQFVAEAPVVIAACGTSDLVMTCGQPAYAIDVAIAVEHMVLAAFSSGIGSCWIGAFYEDQVKGLLGIPDHVRVVALLALGYPAGPAQPTERKGLEEVVSYERW
ncbi:MAG: nitroreductase family protein [Methanothrix sp.]|nr:nitroreductase family protein [Methanothrix sp.]